MVLSTAIEKLPADYRAIVLLRDVEGLSHHEIAETLGLTTVNAKSRVHRARLFLRKQLEAHFSDQRSRGSGRSVPRRTAETVSTASPLGSAR
jgi:RNA polymerase sigma-70 factor, ECF subfamily